ncbi:MAG: phosphate regulon sensor histidine kinase PhoR [Pseudohongiellaceae bacterium]
MQYWRTELNRMLLLAVLAFLVGLLFGNITLAFLVALVGYALFNLRQLYRLRKWLEQSPEAERSPPPESTGLWGGIFDGIYRLQEQERGAHEHLTNIVNKAQESSAALGMGIIMINRNNGLDWWNSACEKLLGLHYPQDRNQLVTNLVRDPRFAEYFQQNDYKQPLRLQAPGDSGRILEFEIALFGEQERLIIVRDISQLYRLELVRKDFVGNVSHELGTPITVVKGYLEAMLDNPEDISEKWRKPVQQMMQQSQRMENIVRDLLLLSTLETGTLPRTQDNIVLHELFGEIRNDTAQVFAEKNHEFVVSCDESLRVSGKRSELYSAISNLVVNAAKYTPPRGRIALSAEVGGGDKSGENGKLRISVEDNGIGIESRHIPRISERFYRVDASRSSETGGTGLGLAIVKHILTRHQGRLLIESTFGEGSRFTAELPAARLTNSSA